MFRFTIRDVLLLMLFVGLSIGWWTDRWQLKKECARRNRKMLDAVHVTAKQWAAQNGGELEVLNPRMQIVIHPKQQKEYIIVDLDR